MYSLDLPIKSKRGLFNYYNLFGQPAIFQINYSQPRLCFLRLQIIMHTGKTRRWGEDWKGTSNLHNLQKSPVWQLRLFDRGADIYKSAKEVVNVLLIRQTQPLEDVYSLSSLPFLEISS